MHDRRWPVVCLADVTTKIGSGATPRGGADTYLPSRVNYALVRSQNVFDRRFERQGLAFISDRQAAGLSGVRLAAGDILLNITGDGVTFGRACLVPRDILPACVNQHVSIIRVDARRADSGFVLAFLTHPDTKRYIESFNAGGSRRAVTKGHIESFRLPLPPLPEQRAIARILGTLDDKIELNRRMCATLEAMARAPFKSWFVDFDPVRAKAEGRDTGLPEHLAALFPDRLVESELGEIPDGWEVRTVQDVLELVYGKALKAAHRVDGPVPVYGSGGITGFHNEALVNGPSVVVGRKGTVGSLYWEDRPFFPIDTVFYVRPKVPLSFCFYHLQTLGLDAMNTDAAVPGLNRNNVYRLPVAWPGENLATQFDGIALTYRHQIRVKTGENETLKALSNTLLPRLISGELRVPDAEALLERAVP